LLPAGYLYLETGQTEVRQARELRAVQAMSGGLNEGIVVDTAKLMMHRPIVRRL
jgi:hypothetical protein